MNSRNNVDFVIFDVCKCESQSEFARLVGVSRQRVTNWKRRGKFPSGYISTLCEKTGLPAFVFDSALTPKNQLQKVN